MAQVIQPTGRKMLYAHDLNDEKQEALEHAIFDLSECLRLISKHSCILCGMIPITDRYLESHDQWYDIHYAREHDIKEITEAVYKYFKGLLGAFETLTTT